MLWSEVAWVCGGHLSGLSAMIWIAVGETRRLISWISSVLLKNDRPCAAASATVCAYCPREKRLVEVCMMLNGSPSFGSVKALWLIKLKKPKDPSKIWLGPVMP